MNPLSKLMSLTQKREVTEQRLEHATQIHAAGLSDQVVGTICRVGAKGVLTRADLADLERAGIKIDLG